MTDTFNLTLAQEELRHRQLTATLEFNAAAYVVIDLVIVEGRQEQEQDNLHDVSFSNIDPLLITFYSIYLEEASMEYHQGILH